MINYLSSAEWPNLDHFKKDVEDSFQDAYWLVSNFKEKKWRCDFGDGYIIDIDFQVAIDDGSLLTDRKNRNLLDTLKGWICVQSSLDAEGGRLVGSLTAKSKVVIVLGIIDYFLLRSQEFKLAQLGLTGITEGDLIELMVRRCSSSKVVLGLYNWPTVLEIFLRESLLSTADRDSIKDVIKNNPFLTEKIPSYETRRMNLSTEEIIEARAWLWINGYYHTGSRPSESVSITRIIKSLFKNTLRGCSVSYHIPELSLLPCDDYYREFKAVAVRNNDLDTLSEKRFNLFFSCLSSLAILDTSPIPKIALDRLDIVKIKALVKFKSENNFTPLPLNIGFACLRQSIDFMLDYGNEIVESYLRLMNKSNNVGISCNTYAKSVSSREYLSDKILDLGVVGWDIAREDYAKFGENIDSSYSRFVELRERPGLYQLIRVLFGAIQIIVGTLTARRNGELLDLKYGLSIDLNEKFILFYNRKSGVGSYNELEARPVPKIVIIGIKLLQLLQDGLIDLGIIDTGTRIFACPSLLGSKLSELKRQSQLNISLDFFCDYFETPIDSDGRRYYIRQHQLRGFFASTFFWYGRCPEATETLRWYLGHVDIFHLYHYIRKLTPSAIFRSVSSDYVATLLEEEDASVVELADYIEMRFGTRNFSIMDHQELTDLVYDLSEENAFDIEPIPFDCASGRPYTFLFHVKERAAA